MPARLLPPIALSLAQALPQAQHVFPRTAAGELLPNGQTCSEADADMLAFAADAVEQAPPRRSDPVLEASVLRAVDWMAARPAEQIRSEREAVVSAIVREGEGLKADGSAARWLQGCDPTTRRILADVNGPLLARLAAKSGFGDCAAVDMLREGAPLVGVLPCSGNGAAITTDGKCTTAHLWADLRSHNASMLARLRDDGWGETLLQQASGSTSPALHLADSSPSGAARGSHHGQAVAAGPRRGGGSLLDPHRATLRCGTAERGWHDESAAGGRLHCFRAVRCHPANRKACARHSGQALRSRQVTLPSLVQQTRPAFPSRGRRFYERCGELPAFFKVDIDSAYRRSLPLTTAVASASPTPSLRAGGFHCDQVSGTCPGLHGVLATPFGRPGTTPSASERSPQCTDGTGLGRCYAISYVGFCLSHCCAMWTISSLANAGTARSMQ